MLIGPPPEDGSESVLSEKKGGPGAHLESNHGTDESRVGP